jgi:hypothetical protein
MVAYVTALLLNGVYGIVLFASIRKLQTDKPIARVKWLDVEDAGLAHKYTPLAQDRENFAAGAWRRR